MSTAIQDNPEITELGHESEEPAFESDATFIWPVNV
jgi:hypothetical protein